MRRMTLKSLLKTMKRLYGIDEEDLEFQREHSRSRMDRYDFLPADFIDSFDQIDRFDEPDDVPGPFYNGPGPGQEQQSEPEPELDDSKESKAKGK